jgi:hypothetical protein
LQGELVAKILAILIKRTNLKKTIFDFYVKQSVVSEFCRKGIWHVVMETQNISQTGEDWFSGKSKTFSGKREIIDNHSNSTLVTEVRKSEPQTWLLHITPLLHLVVVPRAGVLQNSALSWI